MVHTVDGYLNFILFRQTNNRNFKIESFYLIKGFDAIHSIPVNSIKKIIQDNSIRMSR